MLVQSSLIVVFSNKLNGQLSFHLAVKKKALLESRHIIKRPIRTVMFHFFFRVFGIELTISMGLEMAFTLRRHRWDASTALSSHRAFPSDLHSSASTMRQSSRSSESQRSFNCFLKMCVSKYFDCDGG